MKEQHRDRCIWCTIHSHEIENEVDPLLMVETLWLVGVNFFVQQKTFSMNSVRICFCGIVRYKIHDSASYANPTRVWMSDSYAYIMCALHDTKIVIVTNRTAPLIENDFFCFCFGGFYWLLLFYCWWWGYLLFFFLA